MKTIFIILTIFTCRLIAQDTSVVWLRNIDTVNFKYEHNINFIPKALYTYLETSENDIANPNEQYRSGCVGQEGVPSKRLNWVVMDNHNHLIISINMGGWAHRTLYFFLDKKADTYNINELSFGRDSRELSLGTIVKRISKKEFEFEEQEVSDRVK